MACFYSHLYCIYHWRELEEPTRGRLPAVTSRAAVWHNRLIPQSEARRKEVKLVKETLRVATMAEDDLDYMWEGNMSVDMNLTLACPRADKSF